MGHGHACSWLFAQALVMLLLGSSFMASMRNKWGAFVSLGLVGATLAAFYNFTHLTLDHFLDEMYGTAYDPIYLSRDLLWLRRLFVVFAVLTTGAVARSYWVQRGNFDHFDQIYNAALLPLV